MKLFGDRHTIRLNKYNYSSDGHYFVTICTKNRQCLFGEIFNGQMVPNDIGNMINNQWNKINERFKTVELDTFQIMPNHFHGIIVIVGAGLVPALNQKINAKNLILTNNQRATTRVAPTIGDIIGAFKSITTHQYIIGVKTNNWESFDKYLWQRNYYEHIIRSEHSLNRIRQYIRDNPINWDKDRNNLSSDFLL